MEFPHGETCEILFLDLICYERSCGHLSPEMEYLFERHLQQCSSCRRRMLDFHEIVEENQPVRNFG